MKLEQCRYLLEINRLHSISAAAHSLHIAQTTLSAIVKRTEEEFGFTIFQRTPSGVSATATGERFLELLWEVNVTYEELLRIKKREANDAPVIAVLCAPSISMRLAIPITAHFSEFKVYGNLVFFDLASELICEQVLENNAYLGLTYLTEQEIRALEQDSHKQKLHIEKLLEDELCAVVSCSHRLANREYLEAQDLSGESFASAAPARRDKILGDFAFQHSQVTRFSSLDDMCQAVVRYGLVGFASKFFGDCGDEDTNKGYKLIPLRKTENENKMYICLVTCKNRNLRYQENILVSCIYEFFQNQKKPQTNTEIGSDNP